MVGDRAGLIGMAYAYAEIESPDDRQVTITLGSNDGAKLWLNGQAIYCYKRGRNAVADQNIIKTTLHKGANRLLAKIENLGGNWGLYVRVFDPDHVLTLKSF
jgi:hypothetical protein